MTPTISVPVDTLLNLAALSKSDGVNAKGGRGEMRTLKELQECEFENLTYAEFGEHNLSCKEHCPLFGSFCNGGMSCHGGEPIEPPCCSFDDDTILVEKLADYQDHQLAFEKREDARLELEKRKKEKNAEIARKRFEYGLRNRSELQEINALNRTISHNKKLDSFVNSLSSAINWTNKIFRESNCDCPPDVKPSEKMTLLEKENEKAERRIAELKAKIKQNEKNFKQNGCAK